MFDFFRRVSYYGKIGTGEYDDFEILGHNIIFKLRVTAEPGFSIFTGNFRFFLSKPDNIW